MKIALAPDIHCFYNTYTKLNENGKSYREIEWENSAQALLNSCIEKDVKILIAPGDLFTNPRPTAEQILKVATLFQSFEKKGIKVFGITGNHDVGSVNSTCINEVVSAVGGSNRWSIQTFNTAVVGDVGFAFLPFVKNPAILAYNPDYSSLEMSQQLTQIAGALSAELSNNKKVKHKILVGHWSIQGAVSSSSKSLEKTANGLEIILPLGEIINQGWDAALFGHIHKPQILNKQSPFIAYSGSLQRINIGEANDDKGFFIYDTVTEENEFISLPAIEMISISETIATENDVDRLFKTIEEIDLTNKIVQVKYSISKNDIDLVDKIKLIKELEDKKPLSIAGVFPKILEEARQRDISLTESLDAKTSLKKWLELKKVPDVEQKNVLDLLDKYKQEFSEME